MAKSFFNQEKNDATYYIRENSSGTPSADFLPDDLDQEEDVIIITERDNINTGETKEWE